jgi:hypothetical protein
MVVGLWMMKKNTMTGGSLFEEAGKKRTVPAGSESRNVKEE